MTNEAFIHDPGACTNKSMRSDLYLVANIYVLLYFHKWPNANLIPDIAAIYIARLNNYYVFANGCRYYLIGFYNWHCRL